MASSQKALALAATLGDGTLQWHASHRLGPISHDIGDFGRAAGTLRNQRINPRAWLARTLSALGAFAEGRRYGEEALRLATLAGRGEIPVMAHGCLGDLYIAQGDLEHAIRVLEQGLALCRVSSNWNWLRVIGACLGFACALLGRHTEGRALLGEALSQGIRSRALLNHARGVTWLSEVCRLEEHDAVPGN